MKKILLSLFSLSLIFVVSCGKIEKKQEIDNINLVVASKLQEMDNNYSEETLKALSVVIRNNVLINGYRKHNNNAENKYIKVAKQTNNKCLKTKNNDLIEISFDSSDDYTWQKNIKKSEILDFALKNNISLTNLSKIEEIKNNGRIEALKIGDKVFDYSKLAQQFNLESNQITSISQTKEDIIITGKGKNFLNHFDIEQAEQLSKDNYNYLAILSYFFEDLIIS